VDLEGVRRADATREDDREQAVNQPGCKSGPRGCHECCPPGHEVGIQPALGRAPGAAAAPKARLLEMALGNCIGKERVRRG
jgi:hypothetical protein